jgi:hypothetical protein
MLVSKLHLHHVVTIRLANIPLDSIVLLDRLEGMMHNDTKIRRLNIALPVRLYLFVIINNWTANKYNNPHPMILSKPMLQNKLNTTHTQEYTISLFKTVER